MAPVIESFESPIRDQGDPGVLSAARTLNSAPARESGLVRFPRHAEAAGHLARERSLPGKKD